MTGVEGRRDISAFAAVLLLLALEEAAGVAIYAYSLACAARIRVLEF